MVQRLHRFPAHKPMRAGPECVIRSLVVGSLLSVTASPGRESHRVRSASVSSGRTHIGLRPSKTR